MNQDIPAKVYRCFGEGDEALYVGATTDLDARMVTHQQTTAWFARVVRTETTDHENLRVARAVEAEEIKRIRPRWNIQGRGPRVHWSLCDYVEVMMATHARRDESPKSYDIHGADERIARLGREVVTRFPDAGPVVLADLMPHLPPVEPDKVAAAAEYRRRLSESNAKHMASMREQRERIERQDRFDILAELLKEAIA